MVEKGIVHWICFSVIHIDRSDSHMLILKGGPYHDLLHSVLGAYTCYRPDVGYVSILYCPKMRFLCSLNISHDSIGVHIFYIVNTYQNCIVSNIRIQSHWIFQVFGPFILVYFVPCGKHKRRILDIPSSSEWEIQLISQLDDLLGLSVSSIFGEVSDLHHLPFFLLLFWLFNYLPDYYSFIYHS